MDLVTFLTVIFSIPAILFLWFKTGVFVEYVRALKLGKLFGVNKYIEDKETKARSYIQWLSMKYGEYFIVRLILCPFCLGFWFSFFASACFLNIWCTLPVYTLSTLIYLTWLKLLK